MSAEFNDIVKQGYVKLKSKKLGVWQRRWVILRSPSSKGSRRLEKYQEEKHAITGHTPKNIPLKDVKSISRVPVDVKKFAVAVNFTDGAAVAFATESDLEANEWERLLRYECLEGPLAFSSTSEPLESAPTQRSLRDLNERFHVYLLPSPNLDVHGECLMQVTSESIHLFDVSHPTKKLESWPLNCLRRYGRDDSKFTFEAGRFCPTGEGLFVFNTTDGDRIYDKVNNATIAIAEAHHIFNRQQQINSSAKSPVGAVKSLPGGSNPLPSPRNKVKETRSLPLPPLPNHTNRPPAPPPRPGSLSRPDKPLPRLPEENNNNNDDVFNGSPPEGASPLEGATPPTPTRPSTNGTNTVIPPPRPTEGQEEELDDIYEEKYLDPQFRRFLNKRKESLDH